MPTWISGYERMPLKPTIYFVKANGEKFLLRLDEFYRKMDLSETFLWLDESDYERKVLEDLNSIESIEDYAKYDRREVAEKFLTPYEPMIPKSILTNTFHKYYLRIIAQLRVENARLSKGLSYNGPKPMKLKPIKSIQHNDSLLEKIMELNKSNYFDIE